MTGKWLLTADTNDPKYDAFSHVFISYSLKSFTCFGHFLSPSSGMFHTNHGLQGACFT